MFIRTSLQVISRSLLGFFIIASLFFMFAQYTNAQQLVPRFTAREISLDVNPVNPEAFQDVTLSLVTFAIDIDLYQITWFVNKEEVLSGIGEKSLTVSVGQYGESTFVEIQILAKDGRIVKKSINLRPATVDLLWEAYESYVPPFYLGKALPSRGSILKITAMPNLIIGDNHIDPTELDYTWSWGYRVKDTSSGFNKQFMAVKNLFVNLEEIISVEVQNAGGVIRGEGETKIVMQKPELVFYNIFPENTHFDTSKALTTVSTEAGNPVNIGVAPYFFSTPSGNTDLLSYKWLANDSIVASDKKTFKNQLSIASITKGLTRLKLSVESPIEDFQSGSGSLNITSR